MSKMPDNYQRPDGRPMTQAQWDGDREFAERMQQRRHEMSNEESALDELDRLIEEEHARHGFDGNHSNDTPQELPKEEQPYDGMRFFVNVNEAAEGESTTVHVIYGTWSRRENKRRLRKYLAHLGYTKHDEQKRILKDLGFWSKKQLGKVA